MPSDGGDGSAVATIRHENEVKELVLQAGVDPEQLRSLLQSAFQLELPPVGLVGEDGTVFPLSLVGRCPSVVSGVDCTLVVSKHTPARLPRPPPNHTDLSAVVQAPAEAGVLPIESFDAKKLLDLFQQYGDDVNREQFHSCLRRFMKDVSRL